MSELDNLKFKLHRTEDRLGGYMGENERLRAKLSLIRIASEGLLPHLHKVGELANLSDSHPYWAWIAELNDALINIKKVV